MEICLFKVWACGCGDVFIDRTSLIKHIAHKKKGKYKDKHFGSDIRTGGLIRFVKKVV